MKLRLLLRKVGFTQNIMSSLQTRKTTAFDFDFIYDLHRQTFYSYVEQTWGWKEEVQLNGMREDFDSLLFEIICYKEIDIGVISVIEQEDELFLNYIAIQPLHQNKGLGTQILDQLLEQAVVRGVPVKLSVMRVNPAKTLYERLGFRVVSSDENQFLMEWRNR
ncbi:MAG: GNAT family N-acetyltransferase [Nostoc sp.]|uniref:GNAT family N-acetyltransferase n=1 Tax=Nostoc sp. TaxID=1180 RepID=UPI002FF35002